MLHCMSRQVRLKTRSGGLLLLLVLSLVRWSGPEAQEIQRGLHYFAVENLSNGAIEQRGEAGANGIAFDSLILAPNTAYRIWILQAATLDLGSVEMTSPGNGRRFQVPEIVIGSPGFGDSDGDELSDDAERIIGSNPNNSDTDGDGIPDGSEVRQGLNALGQRIARTGIIGSVDTPGEARDVDAFNDLVVIADSSAGLMLFNIFNGMQPMITGQVPTPGSAEALSLAGDLVGVADGAEGVAIVDISDPPASRIIHQIAIGGSARCIELDGTLAFVGSDDGNVVVLDAISGLELDRLNLSRRPIEDVVLFGDLIYVLEEELLHVLRFALGQLESVAMVETPGGKNDDLGRARLFVGGDVAYTVHRRGYNTIDLSDPLNPTLISATTTAQFGWKQIVLNGSGLGLATVSPNQAFDGPHHVSLYDASDPSQTDLFVAEFPTPGVALSVVIYNGIAYVADRLSGLHVINYLAFDVGGNAPGIELERPEGGDEVEEGSLFIVRANVSDDVQVRNVEFYVDDRLIRTDGNFPFEVRLPTGRQAASGQVRVIGRASDTGGNATFSEPLVLTLTPDETPPEVVAVRPAAGDIVGTLTGVSAFFTEAIDLDSISPAIFTLKHAGPDDLLGNGDDVPRTDGQFVQNDAGNVISLRYADPLAAGRYSIRLGTSITDQAGNTLLAGITQTFLVLGQEDSDRDGLPDGAEADLGTDPFDPDTDDDGILDGDEDGDADGIETRLELVLGFNPAAGDTDGDGIPDGAEDQDGDGLPDVEEARAGTNLQGIDSDGDGFDDNLEVLSGSNPLMPDSVPPQEVASPMVAFFNLFENETPLAADLAVSRPVHFDNQIETPLDQRTVPSAPVHFLNNF